MSTDHAHVHETKRAALFRLLSDGRWHAHYELAGVGGVRYSARLLELKRLGYGIDSTDVAGEQGKRYRLASTEPGALRTKKVKVYLEEPDVLAMVDRGFIPPAAKAALVDAHASFDTNREKL
jgi:hypothetical protein